MTSTMTIDDDDNNKSDGGPVRSGFLYSTSKKEGKQPTGIYERRRRDRGRLTTVEIIIIIMGDPMLLHPIGCTLPFATSNERSATSSNGAKGNGQF